jgi:hypothetical protein
MKKMKKNYIFYLGGIFIVIFLKFIYDPIVFLEGDIDKFTETIKQVDDKINTTVTGNSVQNNINNSNIYIRNPNINIPSSVASSIGITAAIGAGMRAMASRTNSLTPITRIMLIGGGGIMGAGLYILGNGVNSVIENKINSDCNRKGENGPFPAKSHAPGPEGRGRLLKKEIT